MAVARFLQKMGSSVVVWDDSESVRRNAQEQNLKVSMDTSKAQIVVRAPGIGEHALLEGLEPCQRVISDIQLFFDFFPFVHALGVTGSNGKSTTCTLIHEGLQRAGRSSLVAGNIGKPIFETLDEHPPKAIYVIELSSYQLEYCHNLPLEVAVCLNLSPHHLERHKSMENYAAIKLRIFRNARSGLISDDMRQWVPDEMQRTLEEYTKYPLDKALLPLSLRPEHNRLNTRAACAVLEKLGISDGLSLLQEFKGLEHRQEWVGKFLNVTYCNDSKSTNPYATLSALKACDEGPVYWIGGGVDQVDDLSILRPAVERITHAFLMGPASARYECFLKEHNCPVTLTSGLQDAAQQATTMAIAQKEDIAILLSPGCASFDAFTNFEHRGLCFKQWIHSFWAYHVAA